VGGISLGKELIHPLPISLEHNTNVFSIKAFGFDGIVATYDIGGPWEYLEEDDLPDQMFSSLVGGLAGFHTKRPNASFPGIGNILPTLQLPSDAEEARSQSDMHWLTSGSSIHLLWHRQAMGFRKKGGSHFVTSYGFRGKALHGIAPGNILVYLGVPFMMILKPDDAGSYTFGGVAHVYLTWAAWHDLRAIQFLADISWEALSEFAGYLKDWEAYIEKLTSIGFDKSPGRMEYRSTIPKKEYWNSWDLENLEKAKRQYESERHAFRIR
jgi:hypothetical protein